MPSRRLWGAICTQLRGGLNKEGGSRPKMNGDDATAHVRTSTNAQAGTSRAGRLRLSATACALSWITLSVLPSRSPPAPWLAIIERSGSATWNSELCQVDSHATLKTANKAISMDSSLSGRADIVGRLGTVPLRRKNVSANIRPIVRRLMRDELPQAVAWMPRPYRSCPLTGLATK